MWQAIHRKFAQVNFPIVLTHQTHLKTAHLLTCTTSLSSFWGDSEPSRHNIDSAQTMSSTRLPSPLFLLPSLPFSWPPCIEATLPLPPLDGQSRTDQASGAECQASHPRLQCLGLGSHSCLSCTNEFDADSALGGDGSITVWSILHPPSSSHDDNDHSPPTYSTSMLPTSPTAAATCPV